MSRFFPPKSSMSNLDKLCWDTRQSGDARARLTPWLYPEHKVAVERGIALANVENPKLAEEIRATYERLGMANAKVEEPTSVVEVLEEVAQEVVEDKEDAPKDEVIVEKPKKRGRKPKISPTL